MTDVLSLVRYDAACRAIAEAKAVDEVLKIIAPADALRAYARQAKNRGLEIDAAEIRMRAERRVGEMMTAGQQAGDLQATAGRPAKNGGNHPPFSSPATLKEAGIDKDLAKRARALARVPTVQFEGMVGEWRDRVQQETERVTTNLMRAGEREHKRDERPGRPLPAGTYRLIYADPPWRYEHIETESRAIENQYPTMSMDEICALPVPAADDCVLFLWATSPKLAESIKVLEAWGFNYRTCAVWDKEKIGMGYYFRQQHELLLVAARGALPVPEPSDRVSSVIRVKRGGTHSRKPVQVIELLESMYPDFGKKDRIELFTREPRAGWTAWGNEPEAVSA